MKEFVVILGAVILGTVLVVLLIGTPGSTSGSLAGNANSVVTKAGTQITDVFP